jgi:fatty acid desaturase
MSASNERPGFDVGQARRIVGDLFQHRPLIYWADFLVTLTIGYTASYCYYSAPIGSARQIVCLLIAGFALFRAGTFLHEIVHLSGRTLWAFRGAWNVLAGIPMLMPSFFYSNHLDHHSVHHYGTGKDGEYLPLGSGTLRELLGFWLQPLLLPVFIFSRYLIGTPISFLHWRLRRWILEHASSYGINLRYRLTIPSHAPLTSWAVLEVCCCLRAWSVVVASLAGLVPPYQILLLYGLAVITLGLNYVRNLVAHHYQSDGLPKSHIEQLGDSITITGAPIIAELFFPVGLRYHALHHLFPSLPYHNLGRAHRRLIAQLPADSLYHQTIYPGFWAVARRRWADAVAAGRRRVRPACTLAEVWYARRAKLLREERLRPASARGAGRRAHSAREVSSSMYLRPVTRTSGARK